MGEAIGLVVKLPFSTPEEFLAKYGANVTRGGIYLRARAVKPPGTAVTLDLKLADGARLIYASAIVHFVTGQGGQGVSGMGLRFLSLDPATQKFLDAALGNLPHAQSLHPPLPAGVGPASYTIASPPAVPGGSPQPAAGAPPRSIPWPSFGSTSTARPQPVASPPPAAGMSPRSIPWPSFGSTSPARPEPVTTPPSPAVTSQPVVVPPPAAAPFQSPPAPQPIAPPRPVVDPSSVAAPSQPSVAPPPVAAPPQPIMAPPPVLAAGATSTAPSAKGPPTLSRAPGAVPVVTVGPPTAEQSAPPFEFPKEEPKRTGPIIGIDLGTTNSCAAIVRSGKPAILFSREGYNTVPSILALNARGKLVVGHPAKGQMLTNPRQTVYGAKRLVGRAYESPIVRQIKDRFAYEIAPGENGEAAVKLGDRIYSLQQISALILREVREIAQNQIGQPLSRAVITVPAYYNDNQRQAVREAGRLAGLHVERILNEPTAAALAYGYGRKLNQRVLVYDLGGGTFDASVLELNDTLYEVISTGGDTFLGGIDFDNAIVAYLLGEFRTQTGHAFQGDRVAMQRILDAAERAKCALSERSEMRVHVAFATMIDGKPYDLDVHLTREKLIQLTERLVDRTIQVCDEVLKAKGLTPKDIDEVILVGGQSRSPLVHEKITRFFGKAPSKGVHPDEAVALGAALLAHSLGQLEGVVLIDVLPMSIGVGLPGDRFKPVLERNVSLPATRSYQLSTNRDGQTEIELAIFQGDMDSASENEYLGTLLLSGLPARPRGQVQVAVTFEVNNESILKVTARELSTGVEVVSTFSTVETPEAVKAKMGWAPPSRPSARELEVPKPSQEELEDQIPPAVAAAANTQSLGFMGWLKRLFSRG